MQLIFNSDLLTNVALQRGDHFQFTEELLKKVSVGEINGWITSVTLSLTIYKVEKEVVSRQNDEDKSTENQSPGPSVRDLVKDLKILPISGHEMINSLAEGTDHYEHQLILSIAKDNLTNPIVLSDSTTTPENQPLTRSPKSLVADGSSLASPENNGQFNFIDLKEQQSHILPAIEHGLHTVLRHGRYILGPEIQELEEKLAKYVGTKHAISCASGTDAILMALMALGIGPGDAVFTSPFTFIATAEVIVLLGATPVFVDIDPRTFNIDPSKLEDAIVEIGNHGKLKPRCIIPVDLFGLPADYDSVASIAKKYELFVVEDGAQSLGGVYNGRMAGSLGDIGATSFFPAKPLGCYGDGGAVFTDDDTWAEKLKSIRVHGKGQHKYENVRIGLNARLDTIQAAILLAKLPGFQGEIDARQLVAKRYSDGISNIEGLDIITPFIPENSGSAWAQYSLLSEKREDLMGILKKAGIPTVIYYPKPLHLQKAFANLGHGVGDFPVSERISNSIFSLPMHPYLKDQQIDRVINALT